MSKDCPACTQAIDKACDRADTEKWLDALILGKYPRLTHIIFDGSSELWHSLKSTFPWRVDLGSGRSYYNGVELVITPCHDTALGALFLHSVMSHVAAYVQSRDLVWDSRPPVQQEKAKPDATPKPPATTGEVAAKKPPLSTDVPVATLERMRDLVQSIASPPVSFVDDLTVMRARADKVRAESIKELTDTLAILIRLPWKNPGETQAAGRGKRG